MTTVQATHEHDLDTAAALACPNWCTRSEGHESRPRGRPGVREVNHYTFINKLTYPSPAGDWCFAETVIVEFFGYAGVVLHDDEVLLDPPGVSVSEPHGDNTLLASDARRLALNILEAVAVAEGVGLTDVVASLLTDTVTGGAQ